MESSTMLRLKCKNPLYWIWNVRRCCKCSLNLPCWIQAVEKSWAFYSSYANWLRWVKASQYDSLRLWCLFPVCIQISWACNAAPLPESCKQQHCSAGDTITVSDGLSDSGFCHHLHHFFPPQFSSLRSQRTEQSLSDGGALLVARGINTVTGCF